MKKTAWILAVIMSLSLMLPATGWAETDAPTTQPQGETTSEEAPPTEQEFQATETPAGGPEAMQHVYEQEELVITDTIPEEAWELDVNNFVLDAFSRSVSSQWLSSARKPRIEKEVIKDFFNGLDKFKLTKTTDAAPEDIYQFAQLNLSLQNSSSSKNGYHVLLSMQNDILTFNHEYNFRAEDPEGLFEHLGRSQFLPRNANTTEVIYTNYNPKAGTIQKRASDEPEKYRLIDRLTFDLAIDESYYETELEEITGGIGNVHGTLTHFWRGYHFFILTLEGSAETREYFYVDHRWQFESSHDPCFVFNRRDQVVDSQLVRLPSKIGTAQQNIRLYPDRENNSLKNVRLEYESAGCREIRYSSKVLQVPPPNPVQAENFEYELIDALETDQTLYDYLFHEKPEITSTPEKQDPTRYKIELRHEYDTHTEDFYIDLATKFNINTSVISTPDWVKEIEADENAEVTFINIASTVNGKYHIDNPAVKIKGADGEKWFWLSSAEYGRLAGDLSSGLTDDRTILLRMRSCLSFDGFTVIRNMEEYDSLSLRFVFTNDDKRELDYMEIDFGGQRVVKTPAEEINYVGDCKAVYEKWMKGGL
ncbi:MAG: hypothetical protein EGR97_09940 [Clostridiales bacterium]|nr:hypothetical protein [Clostridiales bacterium]